MRIGIDLTAFKGLRTGRENAAHNLLRALTNLDGSSHYTVFTLRGAEDAFAVEAPNVEQVSIRLRSLGSRRLWQLLHLYTASRSLDVIHLMESPVPFFVCSRAVAAVYDMLPVTNPEWFLPKARFYYRAAVDFGMGLAKHIIVCSEFTKREVVRVTGVSADRITVVPLGVDTRFRRLNEKGPITEVRHKYSLPDRMILYVGTLEPRKNLVRLIMAFGLLHEQGLDHALVLAGGKGWMYQPILDAVSSSRAQEYIILTGYVPDEDLVALYNAASLVVYPSLAEGFGLPVLEAMACGVPVVCSNSTVFPEVAGDAAVLVDPTDVEVLARAIETALTDEDLRRLLIERGLARVRDFTWERAARETLAVYRRAAGCG